MNDLLLGLDLGPTSIGWALIEAKFDDQGRRVRETGIRAAGVRIFEEGVDRDSKGAEKAKNVQRRTARSARRTHQRRRRRRRRLAHVLRENGLLPRSEEEFARIIRLDPYRLRARALDERLEPFELGRALLHLSQRRGFKSNRKDTTKKKEEGQIAEEISALEKEMSECGTRTLGEHLYRLGGKRAEALARGKLRLRNRHTSRSMYEDEFNAIWDSQKRFPSSVLTDDVREKAHYAIFYQRPFEVTPERIEKLPANANARRAPSVGPCEFEPGERRCHRAAWIGQRFRILKEVNNLEVRDPATGTRPLSAKEKATVAAILNEAKDRTFDQIRKALGWTEEYRFNLEAGDRKRLQGNEVEYALIRAFGKADWRDLEHSEREALREAVIERTDPEELRAKLQSYELPEDKVEKLIHLNIPDGYLHLSRKAIENLLPYLEEGHNEHDAAVAAGYIKSEPEGSAVPRLPHAPDLPNPIVRRALVELRKVVNAIVSEYGLPRRIIVEMAREMKMGRVQRARRSKEIRERERDRDRVRRILVDELGVQQPKAADIEKYLLWEEQKGICPYTGKVISQQALFFSSDFEVDHILPRYRSLDNTYLNKVVSERAANLEKRDRTPQEWLGGTRRYEEMLQRIRRMNMPFSKTQRFEQENVDVDDFTERQLGDTGYITREVVKYLSLFYAPQMRVGQKAVGTTKGQLTAALRRSLGLNNVLDFGTYAESVDQKNRSDHRHHAVDAIVVALSTRKRFKQYSEYRRQRWSYDIGENPDGAEFELPWEEFRGDVVQTVDGINVSHRAKGKIANALHEETFYGPTNDPDVYVYRKRLDTFGKAKEVEQIRDCGIKKLVLGRLKEFGWKEGDEIPRGALDDPKNPVRMPSGVPVKRVRVLTTLTNVHAFRRPGEQKPFRYAKLGENHHVEIVEAGEGKGGQTLKAVVISMMEAARRARRTKDGIVQLDHGPGTKFVTSLTKGDSVVAKDPESGEDRLCVVQKMSPTKGFVDLCLRDARDARKATEAAKSPFKRVTSAAAWRQVDPRKVRVDPLGRIFPAND